MAEADAIIDEVLAEDDGAGADIEMGGEEVIAVESEAASTDNGVGFEVIETETEEVAARVTYIDYLKSPIIEILVGEGDNATVLSAHQALLVQSPFFEDACAQFSENAEKRRIEMTDENLDAVGCFLEYIYTGEYFPQRIEGQHGLVKHASVPEMDPDGHQLLKHAQVYTLADKLDMTSLKTLAHSKIHCVNSTAKGEIAYARYVYATTPKEDTTIRKPVAAFWAQRSHVLRKEAEDEFRQMCLEFPQFGFDVLTRVLDEKSKREESKDKSNGLPMSSRKRQRNIQV